MIKCTFSINNQLATGTIINCFFEGKEMKAFVYYNGNIIVVPKSEMKYISKE